MTHIFLGIDISKDTLKVYNGQKAFSFPNERGLKHFQCFLKRHYKGTEKAIVVIYEPTGPYSAFLEELCARKKLQVVRVNPRKVPYLQEVLGHRAKTDSLDAKALYQYHKLISPSDIQRLRLDKNIERLAGLLSDYIFLRHQETDFANHLEALKWSPFSSPRMLTFIRQQLQVIKGHVKEIRQEMKALTGEDPEAKEAIEKMEEVPGIGFLTALGLFLLFEKRQVRRREEVVALLGLDPTVRESGRTHGKRHISRRGDQRLRALLFMAALCALRVNPQIRGFYERLKGRGKPGKVALVACMRKLALIAWAYYKMAQRPVGNPSP